MMGPPFSDLRATLLVNSSDGFDDCWPIFFTFLERYWPEMTFPVLLNTECKSWTHSSISLRTSRVAEREGHRLTWSECLIRAIDQIDTPLLMYFQEDYFIDREVRADLVDRAIDLMIANPQIGHIALTKHASHGPYGASDWPGFSTIGRAARYRISTQAGLWRPSVLRSYLHPSENGWMFEILGTRRAHRRNDLFLIADFAAEQGGPAIDYIHTGIIKGRWHPAIPQLFARHGISIDTDRRGLYVEPDPIRRKMEVVRKLASNPRHLLNQLTGRFEA